MIYFCNRGRENLRSMTAEDFSLKTDEDGLRYITKRDQLTKNNREDQDESSNMGVMYEVPGCERCPVKSFLKYNVYKSKLNPMCSCFWQKPKQKMPENGNDPWYCNAPLGVNTLRNKMKDISIKSGCSKIYTNHCLRATCITTLDFAGFHSRDIMTVSGHHSEQSIKNYSKTSDKRKKEMSTMLDYITATESVIRSNKVDQTTGEEVRAEVTACLSSSKSPTSNISKEEKKALHQLSKDKNIVIITSRQRQI
ncbi:uncharacterized protein [Diadema antillarum]|uniref:uncharacterized protein n=1 Tax=Diadema antillarum TaxID=105358 RepID=UPI003A8A6A3F